jgi:pSer/pThr/pTyr-binding forkhead associated (FHA) protein
MSKLVLHLADGTTLNIPLDKERITIGRRSDNDICLPNLAVSGEHAAVVTILDDSFLEDLDSTNGTLVNGNTIVKHFLHDRDEIDVGQHKLVYFDKEDEARSGHHAARGESSAATDKGSAPLASTVAGAPPAAPAVSPAKPSVKIVAGPQAGREIPLTKEQTSIGRAGVQVALIIQAGDKFRLKIIEGERLPLVNGQSVVGGGVGLAAGDVIEIAGSKLEFVYRA